MDRSIFVHADLDICLASLRSALSFSLSLSLARHCLNVFIQVSDIVRRIFRFFAIAQSSHRFPMDNQNKIYGNGMGLFFSRTKRSARFSEMSLLQCARRR